MANNNNNNLRFGVCNDCMYRFDEDKCNMCYRGTWFTRNDDDDG